MKTALSNEEYKLYEKEQERIYFIGAYAGIYQEITNVVEASLGNHCPY